VVAGRRRLRGRLAEAIRPRVISVPSIAGGSAAPDPGSGSRTGSRAAAQEIFARPEFRRLLATRLLSQFADGVFQVGLAGYLLFAPDQQTAPGRAAAAAAVLLLPYSFVGPFAGVFIDRWRRRQILVYAPLIRTLAVAATAGLLLAGDAGPLFYLAALVTLGINRFFLAALSAALPHVVGRRAHLVLANSVSVTAGSMLTFAGAGAGYLLGLAFGTGTSGAAMMLLCSAAMYVATSITATTLGRDLLGPDSGAPRPPAGQALRRVAGDLADGARYVWARRPAAAALGAIALHRFLYGITTIMTVLLFGNYFTSFRAAGESGLSGFALAVVVSGAGFLVGAVITPVVTRRVGKESWTAFLLASAAAAEVIFGAPFAAGPYLAGAFALGLVSQAVKVTVDTILQETVADGYRGRVFSVHDMLFNATFVGGFAVAALLLPVSGRSYAVLAMVGAGYALGAAGYRLATRSGAAGGGPDGAGGITAPGQRPPSPS
jgi:hypothetical protein